MIGTEVDELFVKVDGCDGCTGDGQYDTYSSDSLSISGTLTSQNIGYGTNVFGKKVST